MTLGHMILRGAMLFVVLVLVPMTVGALAPDREGSADDAAPAELTAGDADPEDGDLQP